MLVKGIAEDGRVLLAPTSKAPYRPLRAGGLSGRGQSQSASGFGYALSRVLDANVAT